MLILSQTKLVASVIMKDNTFFGYTQCYTNQLENADTRLAATTNIIKESNRFDSYFIN